METKIYNRDGKETGNMTLPASVFGLPWNSDLVHQVVTAMEANARKPIAHTKGRGEVSGGGKKPWKQKGTGRARHGSTRSPIWRHGGVTHGPTKERVFETKINRGAKVKALYTILSRKAKEGHVILIDNFSFAGPKTKEAAIVLKNIADAAKAPSLAWKKGSRALVLFNTRDVAARKSFRNIPSVLVEDVRNLNAIDAVRYQYLLLVDPKESVAAIEKRLK